MSQLLPTDKYTFSYILNELNYGSLQSDRRLTKIFKSIKKSIDAFVSMGIYESLVVIDTFSRYKSKTKKKIILTWKFSIREYKTPQHMLTGASMSNLVHISDDVYTAMLDLYISKPQGISDKDFNILCVELTKNNQLDITLYHEIKHLIDNVENLFEYKHYFHPTDVTDFKQYQKYISQNEEIDSQLISVLLELDKIKKENKKITLEQALKLSSRYKVFIQYLIPSKLSKYKQKIFYYWREIK